MEETLKHRKVDLVYIFFDVGNFINIYCSLIYHIVISKNFIFPSWAELSKVIKKFQSDKS